MRRVTLPHEELEALRLADLEGLTQEEAAGNMGVSRSTFQRVVAHARRQVALALAEGNALQIEGGTFDVAPLHSRGPRRRANHDTRTWPALGGKSRVKREGPRQARRSASSAKVRVKREGPRQAR
jgi:predicted DNA-binding protein (UPF0251 family)